MRMRKGLLCIPALTVGLAFLATFALYLYGGLPLLIRLVNRPVTKPTTEEYAVYSAFIDDFFSSRQPFRLDQQIGANDVVYIADETSQLESRPTLPPLLGVNAFGPEQDFYSQNAKSLRLQSLFHSRFKWALVEASIMRRAGSFGAEELSAPPQKGDAWRWLPHPRRTGPFPENPAARGVLQFSRVGFDWRGRTATLSYVYVCGSLCGQSGGGVLLEKHGKDWHVTEWGTGSVY